MHEDRPQLPDAVRAVRRLVLFRWVVATVEVDNMGGGRERDADSACGCRQQHDGALRMLLELRDRPLSRTQGHGAVDLQGLDTEDRLDLRCQHRGGREETAEDQHLLPGAENAGEELPQNLALPTGLNIGSARAFRHADRCRPTLLAHRGRVVADLGQAKNHREDSGGTSKSGTRCLDLREVLFLHRLVQHALEAGGLALVRLLHLRR
mmetsp:Transcript_69733/g.202351  ORF Transcript_69733/g.202351 Transcript_69733/m.202351 type:complete len:208 (-) Transcript_69733:1408-2031(-)